MNVSWKKLSDLCDVSQGGSLSRLREDDGKPFSIIHTKNLSGLQVVGDLDSDTFSEKVERHHVTSNDVLVSLRGVPIRAAVVQEEQSGSVISNSLALLRSITNIDPFYLAGLFSSDFMNRQIADLIGGVTIPTLNISQLRDVLIPIPAPEYQGLLTEAFKSFDRYATFSQQLVALRSTRLEVQLLNTLGSQV